MFRYLYYVNQSDVDRFGCLCLREAQASQTHSITVVCLGMCGALSSQHLILMSMSQRRLSIKDTCITPWCVLHFLYNIAHYNAPTQRPYTTTVLKQKIIVAMGIAHPPPSKNVCSLYIRQGYCRNMLSLSMQTYRDHSQGRKTQLILFHGLIH